jgi:Pyruvate/2-oxoacid:ferredoxin oxidoreductase gamma subunit
MAPLSMDLLIAGLGGMGVVGLTHRLATLLRTSCPRVYTKESRGFAQRRATVTGVIRAGTQVRSPELISGIGLLIALERSEILRHLGQLRPGATVIASDACVWPSGYSGRRFQPVAMAEVEAKLHAQGVRVITLPVCRWLKDHRLPDTLSSSAALGAFVALAGFTLEDVAALVAANWNDRDRADNLRLCALGLAYAAPAVVAPQLPSAA